MKKRERKYCYDAIRNRRSVCSPDLFVCMCVCVSREWEREVEMLRYRVSIRFSNQDSSSFIPNQWTHTHTCIWLKSARQCPRVDQVYDVHLLCAFLTSSIQVYNWIIRCVFERNDEAHENRKRTLFYCWKRKRWRSQVFKYEDLMICST